MEKSQYIYLPQSYNIIKDFHFYLSSVYGESPKYDLVLTLYNDISDEQYTVCFHNVQDLVYNGSNALVGMLICIIDISDRQMENIHFYVHEEENDAFSFYCKDFEYTILEN